jgi:hypothetical protein
MFVVASAHAQSTAADAQRILKGMSDYLAAQKLIALTFDSDIEIVTKDLQKVQFASSGRILLARPNGLRVSRAGGYSVAELVFDGKLATIYGASNLAYARSVHPARRPTHRRTTDKYGSLLLRRPSSIGCLPGADGGRARREIHWTWCH